MESGFMGRDAYEKHFNPREYLERYYSFGSNGSAENIILTHLLQKLYKTFCLGGLKGDLLIDIGSGPTIYQLLSACEAFREIVATDYTAQNRQELQKWLSKEPGAFDWSPVVKYVCDLEGDRSKWAEKEEKLRRAVSRILECDVTRSRPLGSVSLPQADCLLSTLCLDAACKDLPSYQAALKHIATLLKPGGYLVLVDALRSSYYMIGQQKFSSLSLDQETVEAAVKGAGFAIQQLEIIPQSYSRAQAANDGLFYLVGQKLSQA
ncbi:nicotinamide N-methyltransferase [Ornithorhynchus anatinus]|uniref:nicotinamide N-methyltransferase n=1 Tax=Ornithorhynchus anatinus TaxID=9258 RepID=UPI0000EDCA5B|nr:nicotinamide N-methyltransferase [Ornithorhynchus anatinus]